MFNGENDMNKNESLKEINQLSKRVFVAMSFDQDLNPVFGRAIKPACEECGFVAHRVDLDEHNEKICDRLLLISKVQDLL